MKLTSLHTVTDATFQSRVLKSEKPVVVKFTSANCPPCRVLSPYLKKLRNQYWTHVTILDYQIDAEQNAQATNFQKYIPEQSYPVLVFFYKGEVVNRIVGFPSGGYVSLRDAFAQFASETLGETYQLPQYYEQREAEFVKATSAAEAAFTAEMASTITRWDRDSASFMKALDRVTERADAKLEAGTITAAEHTAIIDAKKNQVRKQKNFQAAVARFQKAHLPIEQKLISAVLDAQHEFSRP